MQKTRQSRTKAIDSCVMRVLCRGLKAGANAAVWLLGGVILLSLPWLAYAYYDGMYTVTWVEWAYLCLLPVLLWRYVGYCRYFGFGFRPALNRLLTINGLYYLVWLSVVGLITSTLIETDYLNVFLTYLYDYDPSGRALDYGIGLVVIYAAAPTRPFAAG